MVERTTIAAQAMGATANGAGASWPEAPDDEPDDELDEVDEAVTEAPPLPDVAKPVDAPPAF